MLNVKKIRGLNLPGTPWATSACCGRPLPLLYTDVYSPCPYIILLLLTAFSYNIYGKQSHSSKFCNRKLVFIYLFLNLPCVLYILPILSLILPLFIEEYDTYNPWYCGAGGWIVMVLILQTCIIDWTSCIIHLHHYSNAAHRQYILRNLILGEKYQLWSSSLLNFSSLSQVC